MVSESVGSVVGGWGVELSGPSWRFGLLQHSLEGLLPVLAVEVQGSSGVCAVQKGIGRTLRWGWVVRCCDRLNLCGRVDESQFSSDPAHCNSHVIPARSPGITPVHHSRKLAITSDLKGSPTGFSQVQGAGGAAHLIGDNTQLIPFAVEAELSLIHI